jgi:hypothetical protein
LFLQSILAFLIPLAIYCWVLAAINRREQPTMVWGLWDCAGMLLALAGVFLVVAPVLLDRFFLQLVTELTFADEEFGPAFDRAMGQWWFFWGGYFTLLLVGIFLMLWWRRTKTVIYNVDTDMFGHVLQDCLERLGLASTRVGDRLLIGPWSPPEEANADRLAADNIVAREVLLRKTTSSVSLRGGAELLVEVFPPMCNVCLHWRQADGAMRSAVEKQLARALNDARTLDNPAANWFMAMTGLLFGLIFLTGMIWIMTAYLLRR